MTFSHCRTNHLNFVLIQAFVPRVAFAPVSIRTTSNSNSVCLSPLAACRTNAKKEKIKRNRENMRKFKTSGGSGGRKGLSRRKLLKKAQSSRARQTEAEFIAKCYLTVPAPNSEDNDSKQ